MSRYSSWSDWIVSGEWVDVSDSVMLILPGVAAKVVALATDRSVSIARIARVVAKDQILATRVLRLANSICAPTQHVTTVHDAIVRIGTAPVRDMVLTVCRLATAQDVDAYGAPAGDLVDHAIGTAYLARVVAEHLGMDVDEAFMCGLLHDLGKLIVLKLSRGFSKFGVPAPTLQEAESVCHEHHPEIGAQILRHWQLPEALESPVRYHHDPTASPMHHQESAVTYLANRLSHRYGFGCEVEDANLLEDHLCTRLGLTQTWLEDLDRRAPGLFQVARQIVA